MISQHVRVLARRFSFTIRRKCRQYRQRQTPALLRHLRSNHKCFWQQLNRAEGALPAPLPAMRPGMHSIRGCVPPRLRACGLLTTLALSAPLRVQPWRQTSPSGRLSRLCLSCQMARPQVAPAGLLSYFAMQRSTSPWTMAAARRSGFWRPSLPGS